MSQRRDPWQELIEGSRGPPPTFLSVLVVCLTAGCIASLFVEIRPWLEILRLTPAVWEHGELWRLVTYGFVGSQGLGPTTVLQLACVYWFGLELCVLLGAGRARALVFSAIVGCGIVASIAQFAWEMLGGPRGGAPFRMMQGQHVVLAACVAAFAARNRHATLSRLRLLFGLTIPSRWLVPLQLGWALIELGLTRDFGGFVGIVAATAWGWRSAS